MSNLTPCKRKMDHEDVRTQSDAETDGSISSTESQEKKRARASVSPSPKTFQPQAQPPHSISNAIADARSISGSSSPVSETALAAEGSTVRNNILQRVITSSQRYLAESHGSNPRVAKAARQLETLPTPPVSSLRHEQEQVPDSDLDRKMPAIDINANTHSSSTTAGEDDPCTHPKSPRSSVTSSTTSLLGASYLSQSRDDLQTLGDVDAVDQVFRKMALVSAVTWFLLVVTTYTLYTRSEYYQDDAQTQTTEFITYDSLERRVPQTAFFILLVGNILQMSPLMMHRIKTLAGLSNYQEDAPPALSGIMVAAIVIQCVALTTNALLGWGPRAVVIDPVTGSRVFLWRWCEWIPLSGFMTLLAESADVSTHPHAWRKPMLFSFSQTVSTACGIILPFCQNATQWWLVMIISCLTFIPIFPRVRARRNLLQQTDRGTTVLEREYYDRRKFAYYLMVMCSIVWSILVGLYFVNMIIHMTTSHDHWLRFPSLAMSCDTIADVMAKVVYTRIIVDAHQAVFASDLRMVRQLSELKQLMSMLWVSSSDVIVISTKQTKHRNATMLSPSFLSLVGANLPLNANHKKKSNPQDCTNREDGADDASSTASTTSSEAVRQSAALVLETERGKIVSAYYVDTSTISGDPHPNRVDPRRILLAQKDLQDNAVVQALRITNTAWTTRTCNYTDPNQHQEPLRALSIVHCDPTRTRKVMCEMKVSRHNQQTAVAVVRDVTERYRRFEAESRAHAETIARQRDMHTANRFTRHEVKNGLLSGIELCRTIGKSLEELQAMLKDKVASCPQEDSHVKNVLQESASHVHDKTIKSLVDLDGTLRGVLDTVLAEVMAREVVHEVYQPRLEELDVPSMLVSNLGMSKDRIPVTVKGGSMPKLLLDAQLIGHIHRNAVSNACKYGKQGGKVHTFVEFDNDKQEFRMEVTNEPGDGHPSLLALGESASEFVFAQGVRLQPHMKGKTEKKLDSSGDGAWIMQKCAKTMNGACNIHFLQNQTLFTFFCPAVPVTKSCQPNYTGFTVPENVFGIGVDDSKIQRKLLSRIMGHAGVDASRQILLGETHEDITEFESTLMNLMDEHPDKKFLVIVDEHLDYDNIALKQQDGVHSGSLIMKQVLDHMPKEHAARLLVLMRSANDSAVDIAMYTKRTHGYFPKAIMQRERTREILAPMWLQRFPEDIVRLQTSR